MYIWDDIEALTTIIKNSDSRYAVIITLNRSPTTYTYKKLKRFIQQHNIDVSHFRKNALTEKSILAKQNNRKYTYSDIFIESSPVSTQNIKKVILRDKLLPYQCKNCGNIGIHNNKPLVLHLEHINGISNDHRLYNLCFLCPNCHSQTDTYCGKNIKLNTPKTMGMNEYINYRRQQLILKNTPLIEKVLNSNIDFLKYGWVTEVALLIDKHPQKIKNWMSRYMPDFYNNCYKKS